MALIRTRIIFLAFITDTFPTGANDVAIRFSNRELDPIWGARLRFSLAAVLLVSIMLAMGLTFPRGMLLIGAMLFGLLQFAGAFGFFYLAFVHIHAGLVQTLLALVPLATLLLAVAQRQERLHTAAVVSTFVFDK